MISDKMTDKQKILEMKAEVYEIIKEQETISAKHGQLQDRKIRLVQDIEKLENNMQPKEELLSNSSQRQTTLTN